MTTVATSSLITSQQCDVVRYSECKFSGLNEHSVALARNWVVGKAVAWRTHPTGVANLQLVVSELITNAFLHTDPPRGAHVLLIHQANGAVRVEVRDYGREDGNRPAVPCEGTGALAENGRGLALVAAFSCKWGIEQIVPDHSVLGHVVWSHPQNSYAPV